MISVYKGVVHPWNCDVFGHMTTRFYVGMFDDAIYHFLFQVFGWTGSSDEEGRLGFVDVRHTIDYQSEVTAGELVEIRACMKKVGGKSMTVYYEMTNLGSGEVAASQEQVSVLFDLRERQSVVITDDLREKAQRHID